MSGIDDPFGGLTWGFNGADSAQNQATNSSFIATGDFLKVTDPADSFPQFESWPAAEYQSGLAGPFDPHTGQSFMWSDRADEAYKRLSRTITVPAGGRPCPSGPASTSSRTSTTWWSRPTPSDRTTGRRCPTRTVTPRVTCRNDQSCTGGWSNPNDEANVLHPFLTHYQTFNEADGTCSSTGSSGVWNAANGSSSGWQQFEIDLGPYAGSQVEVSITSLSDWGLQQFPGVFIDEVEVSTGEGTTSFEDDGNQLDGWDVPGAPQDDEGIEGPNRNDWFPRGGLGIKEGAVIATPRTVYMGHGFEGITGADTRNEIMSRAIDHLLP